MYIRYDLSKVLSTWNEYKYVCAIQFAHVKRNVIGLGH